jgi:hypothetical protein
MSDRQVKVVGKHRLDCFNARCGILGTQWAPVVHGEHGAPVVTTKRRYGRKGYAFKHWIRFICNCQDCPAELHVESDFIRTAAKKEQQRRDKKRSDQ